MKRVCGLDVHKDSIFYCISDENEVVFQEKFDVLNESNFDRNFFSIFFFFIFFIKN